MKISVKALLLGILITITGGLIRNLLFPFLLESDLLSGIQTVKYSEDIIFYISLGMNAIFTIVAGYFTAKVAEKNELLHGALLAIILWAISELALYLNNRMLTGEQPDYTITQYLWPLGLFLLYGLTGAFVRKRINDKRSEEIQSPLEQKIENLGNN